MVEINSQEINSSYNKNSFQIDEGINKFDISSCELEKGKVYSVFGLSEGELFESYIIQN